MTEIVVRPVGHSDYGPTRQVVDEAFAPEDVVTFLDALRADGCILLELLAEDSSGIVAHIAFSRVWLEYSSGERTMAAMLTPLAVRPDRQRAGIGLRLMTLALRELEGNGETLFFVLGHPEYYPKAGFRSVSVQEISSQWLGEPAFMARGSFVPGGRLVLPSVIADAH